MITRVDTPDPDHPHTRSLWRWAALGLLAGLSCGLAGAAFLWAMAWVTATRLAQPALTWGLPIAGVLLGWAGMRLARPALPGMRQVLRGLRHGDPTPAALGPWVLLGTLWTHLWGGSAGREGTAVQLGAAVAAPWRALWGGGAPTSPLVHRGVVAAGVAGGFGAVFGTPIAAVLFVLEVARPRGLRAGLPAAGREWPVVVAATLSAATGHLMAHALGAPHTTLPRLSIGVDDLVSMVGQTPRWLLLGLLCGAVAWSFVRTLERFRGAMQRWAPDLRVRLLVGGLLVLALWRLAGSDAYLGLSVSLWQRAFEGGVSATDGAWKLLLTAATVGAGFVGGEVTPLLVAGASLGGALAGPLALPPAMAAGSAMAALLGAATQCPWTMAVMAAELLGPAVLPAALPLTLLAAKVAGRQGLYELLPDEVSSASAARAA